jgi:hypothetical protein
VTLSAGLNITADSLAPIYLLDAHVINDPLGVFATALNIQGSQAPVTITMDFGYPGDVYFQKRYPCEILIATTGGERLVSIPPPPPLTQQEIERLSKLVDSQISNCSQLVTNWFQGTVFNPRWLVDPGPGDRAVDHYYEFVVNGLATGEVVTIIDNTRNALVRGVAIRGEGLRVSAVVAPAEVDEVGLLRVTNREGTEDDLVGIFGSIINTIKASEKATARGVGVTEQLILPAAAIPLPASCLRLAAAYSDGVPCAIAVLPDRLMTFDLSVPSTPVLRLSVSIAGLRGVLTSSTSLIAFSDNGFYQVDSQGARPAACGCGGETRVFGAVRAGNTIYAVTDAGIELFSSRFSRLLVIPLDATGPIARAGNNLVAAIHKGLAVFSIARPTRPGRKEDFEISGVQDLVMPPGGVGQTLLAVVKTGRAKLVDFSRGDDARVVADYPQFPWYIGSARLGNLFLKLDVARSTIQVSLFGNSQLL